MKATEAQIEERLPVWEALSEFFLDTELQPEDHQRIARTLAATRFTESEIEEILICEVCPVCKWNAFYWEWIGFDPNWLKAEMAPRIGTAPKFRFLFRMTHEWMYRSHWDKVRTLIVETRTK
jgi:hypothetical protein